MQYEKVEQDDDQREKNIQKAAQPVTGHFKDHGPVISCNKKSFHSHTRFIFTVIGNAGFLRFMGRVDHNGMVTLKQLFFG